MNSQNIMELLKKLTRHVNRVYAKNKQFIFQHNDHTVSRSR